jgi:hypothetical protein
LVGYNIYRGGSFLTNVDESQTTYIIDEDLFGEFVYKVVADYKWAVSAPATVNVNQGYINEFPYVQDFSVIPESWTRATGKLDTFTEPTPFQRTDWFTTGYWTDNWMITSFIFDPTHENGNATHSKLNGDTTKWLITPEIYLDQDTDFYLTFDLAHTSYFSADFPGGIAANDKRFKVLISSDEGNIWSSFDILAEWNNVGANRVLNAIPRTGENIFICLADYSGIKKIAFYTESLFENTDSYIHIDNVTIHQYPTSIGDFTVCAPKTELLGNFPNPFNPQTTIQFSLSFGEGRGEGFVKIDVYNVRGQRVRTLVNDMYSTGEHSVVWNGMDDSGRTVGSGIYFYSMRVGEYHLTNRMLLLK